MSANRLIRARHWLALIALCWSSTLYGAEPSLRSLDIRGLRVGGTTTLVLDGDELGKAPRLLLPFPAKQVLKPGGTDKRVTFDVTLPAQVVPGYYQLWLVNDNGVSLPMVIAVDRLRQLSISSPVGDMPVALHGSVAGSNVVEVKFSGHAKQKILVEVEAQRLGSKLRPIVHLYSPKKLQLAWSWGKPALFGDARLEAVLPEDGIYSVAVHDIEYAAPGPSFFRLRIGDWAYVDQVFPPVVNADQPTPVELLGMAMSSSMSVTAPKNNQVLPLPWPKEGLWSGPRPFVTLGLFTEIVQRPSIDKLQELPPGRVALSGKLLVPYGEDRYRVAVLPRQKVRFEVFAERLGSPVDAALILRDDKGDIRARAEDSPGSLDPVLEYTVPDKTTALVVGVLDAQGRAGPRGVYRLTIDPEVSAASGDRFTLMTPPQRISLPANGTAVAPVFAERHGFKGKIDVRASWPPGVRAEGFQIPEDSEGTLITLSRGESDFAPAVMTWHGHGSTGIARDVVVKGHPLERLQPWLATEVAPAPSAAKGSDFVIQWRALPPDAHLLLGSKLVLPVTLTRPGDKSTVKLTLMTSQRLPLGNNQPDPNKTLRQEKPIDVPPPAKSKEPANKTVSDSAITMLVPVELGAPVYDVTVQAQLVAPDKKVLATAYAPVRRLAVVQPLLVKLAGPDRIGVGVDPKKGGSVKIVGKIERQPGVTADVAVALTGLPAGAKADTVTLKANAADFALNVSLPANLPPGELKGLKLGASFAPDAKQPNVRARSRNVELSLIVQTLLDKGK